MLRSSSGSIRCSRRSTNAQRYLSARRLVRSRSSDSSTTTSESTGRANVATVFFPYEDLPVLPAVESTAPAEQGPPQRRETFDSREYSEATWPPLRYAKQANEFVEAQDKRFKAQGTGVTTISTGSV